MRRAAAMLLVSFACAKTAPPHPSLTEGIKTLERVTAQTLDNDFGDPAFEEAAVHFASVPPSSPDYEMAQSLLKRIRAGRERFEANQEAVEAAAQVAASEATANEAAREAKVLQLAIEGRADAEARELRRLEAERQAAEASRIRREEAGRAASALADKREQSKARQVRDARARAAREEAAASKQAACRAAREQCRGRCAWVRDGTGKTGGLGSPASMACMARCPTCD